MTGVRFVEELPRDNRGGRSDRRDWSAVFAALAERPGTWALVAGCAAPFVAQYLKANYTRSARRVGGSLEVTTRNYRMVDGKRRCDVYARFEVAE